MYDKLSSAAQDILQKKFDVSDVRIVWERPQDPNHGDVALPVALQLAKSTKKSPRDIAEALAAGLADLTEVERTEVAGPGYVNVWLTADALIALLSVTREACTPSRTRNDEAPVIIDYCGPNIAKPLGIHHILSTVIGQATINLHRHLGYNVIGWSYPGDWGTQFGKLAVAFERWGDGKPAGEHSVDDLLQLYVRFHEEAEKDPSLEDEAREQFKKLEEGDAKLRHFWEDIIAVTKKQLEQLYQRLNIRIDKETGESFYEDKMEAIVEEGRKEGVITDGERGAQIIAFDSEEDMPPLLMKKSDGSTLYATRDLAMIRYRIDTFHPQSIYYVVDVAQSLHFQQLFAAAKKLGWDLPHLEHVVFGRMRFKDQKMSTRKGTVLKLEDVLDEAVKRADAVIAEHGDSIQTDDRAALAAMMGVGSVSYGILSQNRKMDIVFDWDKVLSFDGNSAPYLQYTHARARSVLRKAGVDGAEFSGSIESLSEKERVLINTLLQFASVLEEARQTNMPHTLAQYLFALCQQFNTFYNDEPILKAEEPQKSLRLTLTSLTASVLKTGAELLTISVPDRM